MKLLCVRIADAVLGPPAGRSGGELIWRCPNHDDRHPSLKLNPNKNCFLCGPCGASGGAWKFAAFLFRLDPNDKPSITSQLRQHGLLGNGAPSPHRNDESQSPVQRVRRPAHHGGASDTTLPAVVVRALALEGKKVTAVYPYTDRTGEEELFIKIRYEPKDFRIARPDGKGRYIFGSEGITPVLFRLPEVERATQVLLLEGERDALTAEKLGFVATTKPHGVGESIEHYIDPLRGKDIALCYDNDQAGRSGAFADARCLRNVARSLKVIAVPTGKDLTEWVANGGTREELQKLIAESVELKPSEYSAQIAKVSEAVVAEPGAETTIEKCPALPETAWHGPSREYREIVGMRTEASHNYHLPCFLSAVGACLGRSVYIEKAGRHYPNLFAVLVGPSGGARKGTALGFGIELAAAIYPKIGIVRSLDSREGFIDHLADIGKQQGDSGSISAIVRLAEFRSLIEKTRMEGLGSIVPMLCDAYDCPPSLEVNTRKNRVSVSYPTVSLLAATTQRWIEGLTDRDLEGGLGNRIMWTPGEPGEAIPNPPAPDHQRWNTLVGELSDRILPWRQKRSTEFSFSPAATARWEKIYTEFYTHRADDPLIAILCERLQNHCLKVALIFAALEGPAMIDLHHLEAAYAFTQFLYDGLWYLFRGFGMSPMAQLDAKIVEVVKDGGPIGIRLPRLKKRFWRTDMEVFNRRLLHLTVTDGPLQRVSDGRKVIISLADS